MDNARGSSLREVKQLLADSRISRIQCHALLGFNCALHLVQMQSWGAIEHLFDWLDGFADVNLNEPSW